MSFSTAKPSNNDNVSVNLSHYRNCYHGNTLKVIPTDVWIEDDGKKQKLVKLQIKESLWIWTPAVILNEKGEVSNTINPNPALYYLASNKQIVKCKPVQSSWSSMIQEAWKKLNEKNSSDLTLQIKQV
jgi:hypothetical protein